jgi:hypothetical protein
MINKLKLRYIIEVGNTSDEICCYRHRKNNKTHNARMIHNLRQNVTTLFQNHK